MKKTLILILFYNLSFGQNKVTDTLSVKLKPQQGCNLCWAASIEMITKSINPKSQLSGQKEIVQKCLKLDPSERNCLTGCENCNDSPECPRQNSYDMEFEPKTNRYDECFSILGYKVKVSNDTILKWDKIIHEIKRKRPMMVLLHLNKSNDTIVADTSQNGNHMVVISGYIIDGKNRFVKIKNPWKQCHGKEEILDYESFFRNHKTTFISDILPQF